MLLLFLIVLKETNAPVLNPPDPFPPLHVGEELRVTVPGSFSGPCPRQ